MDGVGPAELGIELQPQPGSGRHGDHAVLHFRQRGHQIAVPGAVEGAHALLHERVRRVERQVRRGGEHDRAGAVVRRDRQVPGLRHRGDLARLREAAAPGDVEHDDAGRAGLQQVAEGPAAAQRLRGRDRRRARRLVALEVGQAVHADRVFVPEGGVGRQRLGDLHRRQQLPHRVELDHDVHPVADRLADLLERLQRRLQVGGGDVLAARLLGGMVERPDLHRRDALVEQLLRPVRRRGAGSR